METCLSEITKIMLTARATYDLIHAGAENKAGKNRPVATVWPEFIDWIDDGKGELGVDYRFDTGETLLSQKITRHE